MPPIIAKFCDQRKQHFATGIPETVAMEEKSINQIVAEALRFYIGGRWSNVALAKEAGVAANTVKNCLEPEKRQGGASGKEPSVKLTELSMIAAVLGLRVPDLTTDATDEERLRSYRKRAAEYYAEHGVLPSWAPDDKNFKQKSDQRAA